MVIEQSVVYAEGYITCGSDKCVAAAEALVQAILNEDPTRATDGKFVIFSTMTPKDEDSWRIVPVEDHPDFLKDEAVMTKLFEGEMANVFHPNHLKEIYYCAMSLEKVEADIKEPSDERSTDDGI
jgi:hypothetical protein